MSVIFYFQQCALHPPISEELVFSHDYASSAIKLVEVSTSFSKTYLTSKFENDAFNKYGRGIDSTLNPAWQYGFSLYGLACHFGNNFSLGLSPGLIFIGSGVDMTAKFSENNFVTLSGNLYRNYEFIFQHKIYDDRTFGLSIGGFVRSEKQEFDASAPIQWKELVPVNVIGVRGLYFVDLNQVTLRGYVSLGIDVEYKTPVSYLGISYKIPFWNNRRIPPPIFE